MITLCELLVLQIVKPLLFSHHLHRASGDVIPLTSLLQLFNLVLKLPLAEICGNVLKLLLRRLLIACWSSRFVSWLALLELGLLRLSFEFLLKAVELFLLIVQGLVKILLPLKKICLLLPLNFLLFFPDHVLGLVQLDLLLSFFLLLFDLLLAGFQVLGSLVSVVADGSNFCFLWSRLGLHLGRCSGLLLSSSNGGLIVRMRSFLGDFVKFAFRLFWWRDGFSDLAVGRCGRLILLGDLVL